jgi:hypothetical protein
MPLQRSQWVTGVAALAILGAAFLTGGPEAGVALTPVTVVADLGSGQAVSDALRAAVQAQRAAPDDLTASLSAARMMIAEGRAKGDSRLVGAALSVLHPFLQTGDPAARSLASTARQYQHDFPGALELLDAVLAASPQDVNALLNRATIRTVQGDYPAACARPRH